MIDLTISAIRQRHGCILSSCKDEAKGVFKLLLTPEKLGTLEVQIEKQKYDWAPTSTYTGQFAVKDPTIIPLSPLSKDSDSHPRRYGSVSVTCMNIKRQAWRLPNGNVILPGNPLLSSGWSSSSWVGDPRGPDLARFDQEALAALGFTPGFYAHNSCPAHDRCKISGDEIRAQSTELSELGYCDRMKVAATELSPDMVRGTVTIVGSAPYESLFQVTAPIETYLPAGMVLDPDKKSLDITANGAVDVEVPANGFALLVFHAFDDITHEGRLPLALPYQLQLLQTDTVGETKIYTMQFRRSQGH